MKKEAIAFKASDRKRPHLVERAIYYADIAHRAVGQVRKYTNEPYVNHLTEVGELLTQAEMPANVVAAGILHDILEDTKITFEELAVQFGEEVAGYVREVTDVSQPQDGNRSVRKAKDLEHLKLASYYGATIKYADLISNTRSIVEHDIDFAIVYLTEKAAILDAVRQGHLGLWELANKTLIEAKVKLDRALAEREAKKVECGVKMSWHNRRLWAWVDESWFSKDGEPGKNYRPVVVAEVKENHITFQPRPDHELVNLHHSWFKKGDA